MKQIVELGNRECRWPVAEDADEGHWFCAEHTATGESYCPTHHALSLPEGVATARQRDREAERRRAPPTSSHNRRYDGREVAMKHPPNRDSEPDLVELFGEGK